MDQRSLKRISRKYSRNVVKVGWISGQTSGLFQDTIPAVFQHYSAVRYVPPRPSMTATKIIVREFPVNLKKIPQLCLLTATRTHAQFSWKPICTLWSFAIFHHFIPFWTALPASFIKSLRKREFVPLKIRP